MQAIAPVTTTDLLAPTQEMLYRLEIYDGSAWRDMAALGGINYLKSVSLSLGGAGVSPDPIAGTWSATLANDDGIFHPFHPDSEYADLLRIGREVRISVGGRYDGTDYYWQRLIGYMDAPRFDHGSRTVELSGMDYMKRLADTRLGETPRITESGSGSGSSEVGDEIRGPSRWGRRLTLDSVDSFTETGAQLYDKGDAMDLVIEGNNISGDWLPSDATFTLVGPPPPLPPAGGDGSYAGRLDPTADDGEVSAVIANLVADTRYVFRAKYWRTATHVTEFRSNRAGRRFISSRMLRPPTADGTRGRNS